MEGFLIKTFTSLTFNMLHIAGKISNFQQILQINQSAKIEDWGGVDNYLGFCYDKSDEEELLNNNKRIRAKTAYHKGGRLCF